MTYSVYKYFRICYNDGMRRYRKQPTEALPENFFYYYVTDSETPDIIVLECGKEKCLPDKEVLSRCYNYYALHCVHSGKGYYTLRNRTYSVTAGQIFCFFPGEHIVYYPDKDDPWEYSWVNFIGVNAKTLVTRAQFSVSSPVYAYQSPEIPAAFSRMMTKHSSAERGLFSTAYTYEILACLIDERQKEKPVSIHGTAGYVTEALAYINQHLSDPELSLKTLASSLNISESYLSRLFKAEVGTAFVKYVQRARISKACYYLEHTDYLNKEIAFLVGFSDPLYFSSNFRRITGLSTYEYRQIHLNSEKK